MRVLDISPYYWEKMVLTMGSTLVVGLVLAFLASIVVHLLFATLLFLFRSKEPESNNIGS